MESGEDRDADLADHAGEVCDGDPAKEPLRLAGEGPDDAMEEETVAAASQRQRGPGGYHLHHSRHAFMVGQQLLLASPSPDHSKLHTRPNQIKMRK